MVSQLSGMICTCLSFCDASTFTGHETPTSKQLQRPFDGCDLNTKISQHELVAHPVLFISYCIYVLYRFKECFIAIRWNRIPLPKLRFKGTWDILGAAGGSVARPLVNPRQLPHSCLLCGMAPSSEKKTVSVYRKFMSSGPQVRQGRLHVFQGGRCPGKTHCNVLQYFT